MPRYVPSLGTASGSSPQTRLAPRLASELGNGAQRNELFQKDAKVGAPHPLLSQVGPTNGFTLIQVLQHSNYRLGRECGKGMTVGRTNEITMPDKLPSNWKIAISSNAGVIRQAAME